jgi:hypothetical protein
MNADLLLLVFSYLPADCLALAECVCETWRGLIRLHALDLWRGALTRLGGASATSDTPAELKWRCIRIYTERKLANEFVHTVTLDPLSRWYILAYCPLLGDGFTLALAWLIKENSRRAAKADSLSQLSFTERHWAEHLLCVCNHHTSGRALARLTAAARVSQASVAFEAGFMEIARWHNPFYDDAAVDGVLADLAARVRARLTPVAAAAAAAAQARATEEAGAGAVASASNPSAQSWVSPRSGSSSWLHCVPPAAVVEQLNIVLFDEYGLRGADADRYYEPSNSYMDVVLLGTKTGLPITLVAIYNAVARRAGIGGMAPFPLPGHFVVEYRQPDQPQSQAPIYIDVYNGGAIVNAAAFPHMSPQPVQDQWSRVLGNLTNAYNSSHQRERVDAVSQLAHYLSVPSAATHTLEFSTAMVRHVASSAAALTGLRPDFEPDAFSAFLRQQYDLKEVASRIRAYIMRHPAPPPSTVAGAGVWRSSNPAAVLAPAPPLVSASNSQSSLPAATVAAYWEELRRATANIPGCLRHRRAVAALHSFVTTGHHDLRTSWSRAAATLSPRASDVVPPSTIDSLWLAAAERLTRSPTDAAALLSAAPAGATFALSATNTTDTISGPEAWDPLAHNGVGITVDRLGQRVAVGDEKSPSPLIRSCPPLGESGGTTPGLRLLTQGQQDRSTTALWQLPADALRVEVTFRPVTGHGVMGVPCPPGYQPPPWGRFLLDGVLLHRRSIVAAGDTSQLISYYLPNLETRALADT